MKQTLSAILFLLIFASVAFSQQTQKSNSENQTNSSSILEQINLRFDLEGIPKPEDVGFDQQKSKWNLKYELRLSDEKIVRALRLNMYAKCPDSNASRSKCISKANKKFDKRIRKNALFIAKGKFQKKPLSSEINRSISIPVKFTPQVINILDESVQTSDNPFFILNIKSKVWTKNTAKKKIKYNFAVSFDYPLKLLRKDGSFDFYNITEMGATIRIDKEDDGKIFHGIFKN